MTREKKAKSKDKKDNKKNTTKKKSYLWQDSYPNEIKWDVKIPVSPIYKILDDSIENFPDKGCIDFFGKTYTYLEVGEITNQLAKGLQDIGVTKGTKVGIMLPNCPHYIFFYFAILKIGGIVVNYNPLYTVNELKKQVQDSQTKILVTLNLTDLYKKSSNLLQTTQLEKVIICNFINSLPFPKNKLFSLFKRKEIAAVTYGNVNIDFKNLINNDGKYKEVDINPEEDVAIIQYTGGTTGVPKGALLTHQNIFANTFQASSWFFNIEKGQDKMIAVLPFFHVFAMTAVMLFALHKAAQLILYPRLDLNQLLKDIDRKKATLMPGVPTLFSNILGHDNLKKYNLSSIKACISGGAPLPLEVKQEFEEITGCKLIEGYGLTESSPVGCANPLDSKIYKDGSIGLPLPGTIVEIREHDGKRKLLSPGKIGEICLKGPQVMKGYFNNKKETDDVIINGRLHTGDLGYIDKDGFIFVVDRLKEMIISCGFNVYPREVEEVIYKHHSIEEVAVVGIPDKKKGQIVKAFVKLKLGEKLTKSDLLDFLHNKLTKYKLPKEIEFLDNFPKTMIGKIAKKELTT